MSGLLGAHARVVLVVCFLSNLLLPSSSLRQFAAEHRAVAGPRAAAADTRQPMPEAFSEDARLLLPPPENQIYSAAIDRVHGYAYFGTQNVGGQVVKVRLSDFTRAGGLTVNSGSLTAAAIDRAGAFAYFGASYLSAMGNPGQIID